MNVFNQCLKIAMVTCCSWNYESIYWCARVLSASTCSSHTSGSGYWPQIIIVEGKIRCLLLFRLLGYGISVVVRETLMDNPLFISQGGVWIVVPHWYNSVVTIQLCYAAVGSSALCVSEWALYYAAADLLALSELWTLRAVVQRSELYVIFYHSQVNNKWIYQRYRTVCPSNSSIPRRSYGSSINVASCSPDNNTADSFKLFYTTLISCSKVVVPCSKHIHL